MTIRVLETDDTGSSLAWGSGETVVDLPIAHAAGGRPFPATSSVRVVDPRDGDGCVVLEVVVAPEPGPLAEILAETLAALGGEDGARSWPMCCATSTSATQFGTPTTPGRVGWCGSRWSRSSKRRASAGWSGR